MKEKPNLNANESVKFETFSLFRHQPSPCSIHCGKPSLLQGIDSLF
jgi:hypothetical protein